MKKNDVIGVVKDRIPTSSLMMNKAVAERKLILLPYIIGGLQALREDYKSGYVRDIDEQRKIVSSKIRGLLKADGHEEEADALIAYAKSLF